MSEVGKLNSNNGSPKEDLPEAGHDPCQERRMLAPVENGAKEFSKKPEVIGVAGQSFSVTPRTPR